MVEVLEPRQLLAAGFQNPLVSLNVNDDQHITPLDALLVIGHLNNRGAGAVPDARQPNDPYVDVNGDGNVTPLDALLVIGALNSQFQLPLTLTEGERFVSAASITVGLGQSAGARTYRLQVDARFDTTDQTAATEDVFAVYLRDPANAQRTLLDRGEQGTALFSLVGGRAEYVPGQVRFDGTVLEIDLTSLATASQGQLVFQLLNSDNDTGTTVSLTPVSNEIDTERAASPVFDARSPVVAAGPAIDTASLSTAGDGVQAELSNIRLTTGTPHYQAELRLRNDGPAIGRDAVVTFPGLPTGVRLLNPSGTTPAGDPYVNLSPAIPRGGLRKFGRSDGVLLDFENPSLVRFPLLPVILAGANAAPVFGPLGPFDMFPGGRLEIPLGATDPDGDPVTYSLRSDIVLPNGMLAGNGKLVFTPSPEQRGTYEFTIIASDGALETSQPVTLRVNADLLTTTRVSGFILDVDQSPLAGMQVEIGAVQGLTMADGSFTLDLGTGPVVSDTLKIRGETFPGPAVYPFIAEKLPLVLEHDVFAGVNNVIDRPIFLPKLDVASGRTIDPSQDTTVTTAAIPGASVFVAAGTLMNQQGTPFTGVLSITEVPPDLTPAALPANLTSEMVVTIQPGEMSFARPAPLTLPNRSGFDPGMVLDLWSINPSTGEFEDVGDMRVSTDGSVVETISGGIRNSSWHFASPPPPPPPDPSKNDWDKKDCCQSAENTVPAGSEVALHSGALSESHELVGYSSQGIDRGLRLHYDSLRADPRPIVHFEYDDGRVLPTSDMSVTVTVRDGDFMAVDSGPQFFRLPRRGGPVAAALQLDLRSLPSGRYESEMTVTAFRPTLLGILFTAARPLPLGLLHVNGISSPFGSGWGLGGWQQIVENGDGSVLLIDGDGTELMYEAPAAPGGPHLSPPSDYALLQRQPDGAFRRTTTDGTAFDFDARNQLALVRDRQGNETRYVYDDAGRLVSIRDPVGLATHLAYAENRVSTITDPAGRVSRLEYDAAGNLVRITDPDDSRRTFEYDTGHRLTAETDRREHREEFRYDFAGRIQEVIHPDGSVMRFAPVQVAGLHPPDLTRDRTTAPLIGDLGPTVASVVDAQGHVTRTQLNVFGQTVSAQDSVGALPEVRRDADNHVTQTVNARGFETHFDTDDRGNVTQIRDELSAPPRDAQALFSFPTFALSTFDAPDRAALGDVNGDGNVDAVVTGGGLYVLLGNGHGGFGAPATVSARQDSDAVRLTDSNGDGRLDIVVARNPTNFDDDSIGVFLGNGDGTFTETADAHTSRTITALAVGDVNGDDRPDVAVATEVGTATAAVTIRLGNGDGTFAAGGDPPTIANATVYALELADVDGDGDLDLVALAQGSFSIVNLLAWRANGDGTFGDPVTHQIGTSPTATLTLALGDVDRDGDLDVAVGTSRSISILRGAGDGTFVADTVLATSSFAVRSVVLDDVDADGDLDVVTGYGSSSTSAVPFGLSIHRGDGAGAFGTRVDYAQGLLFAFAALADLNRDGEWEVVAGQQRDLSITVLAGLGDDALPGSTSVSVTGAVHEVAAGDMNGDGIPDLVAVFSRNAGLVANVQVIPGMGNGTYDAPAAAVPTGSRGTYWLRLADVNGDGNLDVVTAGRQSNAPDRLAVQLGNGDGMLGSPIVNDRLSLNSEGGLQLADMNRDGRLDLIVRQVVAPFSVAVALGDGTGAFGDPIVHGEQFGADHGPVAVADVDRDGNLDTIITHRNFPTNERNVVLLPGRGDGTFGSRVVLPIVQPGNRFIRPKRLDAGDLNGDGRPDIVTANESSLSIFLQNADGSFAAAQEFLTRSPIAQMLVRDLTGDGALDVVVAHGTGIFDVGAGASISVLAGDGRGGFAESVSFATPHFLRGLAIADLDQDGDLDFATGTHQIPGLVSVQLNTTRQSTGGGGQEFGRFFEYDPVFNQLTRSVDELGRQTLYEIDPANGNRLSITQVVGAVGGADDVVTRFTYTAQGLLDTETDPLGRVTDHDYDAFGREIRITFAQGTPDEASRQFEYDAAGNLAAEIDENGRRTEFAYDAMNRRVRETRPDPDGPGPLTSPVTTFAYDAHGNLLSTTDPRGNVTRQEFDDRDQRVRVVDAAGGATTYRYDPNGNRIAEVDPLGRETRFRYDGRNRLVETIDAAGGRTQQRYDRDGNLVSVIDANGNRTAYVYDARGRTIAIADALGGTQRFAYDPVDNLVARTDANGGETRIEYDALNRRVREFDPLNRVTTWEYDLAGQAVRTTDALQNVTQSAYDGRGRLVTTTDPLGRLTTNAYDDAGNLVSTTDALGRTTRFEFDTLDRQTARIDALGNALRYEYDASGNVVAADDAGLRVQFGFDVLNRQVTSTDSAGNVSRRSYDAVGNLATTTDELGHVTAFAYDSLDRRIGTTDPTGGRTQFAYDRVGQLTRLTDASGNVTSFAYDAANRVVTETDPLGAVRRHTYDAAGNRTSSTDRNGRLRQFQYDALHRPVRETWVGDGRQIDATYDALGRQTSIRDGNSSLAIAYDAVGRAVSVTAENAGAPAVEVRYTYDAANNVRSVSDSVNGQPGGVTAYEFDALNRATRLTQTGAGVSDKRVDLTYDALDHVTTVTRFADLSGTQPVVASESTYDDRGLLDRLVHRRESTVVASYDLAFDPGRRITQITDVVGPIDFRYDDRHQLTRVDQAAPTRPDESFAYDAAGNRTSSTAHGSGYEVGPGNRLLSDGIFNYAYDNEGNLTRRTEIATGNVRTLSWDFRNRLVAVVDRSAGGETIQSVTYAYDALDRRIAKTVGERQTQFVYDRANVLLDFVDSDGPGPNEPALAERYLHAHVVDQVFAQDDGTGEVEWHLPDHLGTVRDLVDDTGTVVDHRDYDAFGNVVSETNPARSTRYGFTGRELDAETGDYFYRARYYDPETGRFISTDPIGFESGDTNLYRYVENDPIRNRDPSGLVTIPDLSKLSPYDYLLGAYFYRDTAADSVPFLGPKYKPSETDYFDLTPIPGAIETYKMDVDVQSFMKIRKNEILAETRAAANGPPGCRKLPILFSDKVYVRTIYAYGKGRLLVHGTCEICADPCGAPRAKADCELEYKAGDQFDDPFDLNEFGNWSMEEANLGGTPFYFGLVFPDSFTILVY